MRVLTSKEIFIPNAQDEPIPIQAKNVFQPRKNLGHYKCPERTSKTQIDVITKKAVTDGFAIITSELRSKTWSHQIILLIITLYYKV